MVEYANPDIARRRLVEEILPRAGIRDSRVLEAMGRVPRHHFVDEALRLRAYEDKALPIGSGQTISQPSTVAYIAQSLELGRAERVLEIGSGSGYQTAILALLVEKVFSIERIGQLAKKAWRRLDALGLSNVAIRIGDGTYGWPDRAPYDAIIVSAGTPEVPHHLIQQLRVGGRMVIPVGSVHDQKLIKFVKRATGMDRIELDPCRFVKLIGKFGWQKVRGGGGQGNHAVDS